jgi:hypothetical protein
VDLIRSSAAVVAAFTVLTTPLAARNTTLVAGVADAETGAAIEGAEVMLPDLRLAARTNTMGEARIDDIPAGRHLVRVRFLGYAPSEISLVLRGDTAGAVFRLERVATSIATVNVNGRAVPIRLKDFEIRRRQGLGRFLLVEDLEKMRLEDFALASTTKFPGLRAYSDRDGHWHVASVRDHMDLQSGVSNCDIQVYLDDIPLVGEGALDFLRTSELAGVEYYTAAEVPVRYRTKAYGCGVMLLWTKW